MLMSNYVRVGNYQKNVKEKKVDPNLDAHRYICKTEMKTEISLQWELEKKMKMCPSTSY